MYNKIGISGQNGYIVLALPRPVVGEQALRRFVAGVLRGLRTTPGMGRRFVWYIPA